MNHFKYFVYILLFQFLLTGTAFAEINSWVDENGVRHYSNSVVGDTEGAVEVFDEVENKEPPKQPHQEYDNWRERMEKRKAEQVEQKKERMLKEQAAERKEKIKTAYDALIKLKNLVAGDIDWDEYEMLVAEAKQKIDALAGIAEAQDERALLNAAYESYAVVLEMKRLELTEQRKGLIAQIEKINEEWNLSAPFNYYKARRFCWQRASDKLDALKQFISSSP